ncbi:MAG: hypothetical protein KDC85_23495 [Saprospiraceae bacterium]|nr:hypothetical protein [Saprospiraceae bacterium]MCB9326340.1 hypothetical protein [Lewinellaceae bacterium]
MNKTTLPIFKIQLLMAGLFLSQTTFYGQNLNINYTPLESICSFDTLGCTGVVSFPFSLSANETEGLTVTHQLSVNGAMPGEDLYGSLSGVYPGYFISGNYPIGQYTFEVTAIRGVDTLVADVSFSVVDCVAPVLECVNGLAVTLMPQSNVNCCGILVFASSFVTNALDYCSEPLTYSIHRTSEIISGEDIPSMEQDSIFFDCNDESTISLTVFIWDNTFNPYALQPDGMLGGPNYSSCELYVFLQIWPTCVTEGDPVIAGFIGTEDDEGVGNVKVVLTNEAEQVSFTATDGSYYMYNIYFGEELTISPSFNGNPNNGVSTFDAVLIQKHILGLQTLDSPYKIIAADVNHSGHVSILDIIQLRKLILGIYDEFPENNSWRFVDASYVFPDPNFPWAEAFPEVIHINNSSADQLNVNFIAIKIGDVNGSALPN